LFVELVFQDCREQAREWFKISFSLGGSEFMCTWNAWWCSDAPSTKASCFDPSRDVPPVLALHSLQRVVSTKGTILQSRRERVPAGPVTAVLLQHRVGPCHLFPWTLWSLCRIHGMWLRTKPVSGIQSGQRRCLLRHSPPDQWPSSVALSTSVGLRRPCLYRLGVEPRKTNTAS